MLITQEKRRISPFFPLRPNTYMEITRIKEDVGYRPQYDIERGLEEYRVAKEPSSLIEVEEIFASQN